MDRRTLLRGGLALAGGALMPAADFVHPEALAAKTHELRRRFEEARPYAMVDLELHAASLSGLVHWNPRTGLHAVAADACATAAMTAYYAGRSETALRWARQGMEIASAVDDADAHALNTVWMADALLAAGQSKLALPVLDEIGALRGSEPIGPYTKVAVEAHRALASAAAGDSYASVAAIDRADVALDQATGTSKPNWARTVGPNWLAAWRAESALRMRRPHLAEDPLRQVLTRSPARLTRARAEARVGLAEVALARRDLEEACVLLVEAAPVLKRCGANKELRQIHTLRRSFTPYADSRHVRELDEVLNA